MKVEHRETETRKQFITRELILPIATAGSPLMSFFGSRVRPFITVKAEQIKGDGLKRKCVNF